MGCLPHAGTYTFAELNTHYQVETHISFKAFVNKPESK